MSFAEEKRAGVPVLPHEIKNMKSKTTVFALLICIVISQTASAQELDTYGGFTDIQGEKTGFFHTQKIDGRWWLVTPQTDTASSALASAIQ